MKAWFVASVTLLILTTALLMASPPWLLRACNNAGSCGLVSPFLVGFVGIVGAAVCAMVGMMRGPR